MNSGIRDYVSERAELASLRPQLEGELARTLSEKEWVDVCADFPPTSDEEQWLDDVVVTLRRRDEARRSAAPESTEDVRPVESEDPRYAGLAEILALEATHDPQVIAWRKRCLPDGLVDEDQIPASLARIGESARWATLEPAEVLWRAMTRARTSPPVEPLQEAARIADRLARGFPWLAMDVLIFLITGRAPRYFPLVVRTRATDRAATSRITLEVDPRLPRRELVRAYAEAQASGRLVGLAGGPSRKLERRTTELAVFIARNLDAPWRERHGRWNNEHPDLQTPDVRAFRTEARRAWQRVVGGELPTSGDEWLSDIRGHALMDEAPGTLPRAGESR